MENQKQVNEADEIDLGQLIARIGKGFRNFGMSILHWIASMRRIPMNNPLLFTSLIILALVVGFSYSSVIKKKSYKATMILSSDYLNNRIMKNTIEKLALLADEKVKRGLAITLGISDSLAQNIVDFDAKPFVAENDLVELEVLKEQLRNAQLDKKNDKVIEQVLQRIETENRHAFELMVWVNDPKTVKELQTAILNFFRNNEYLKKRIEINKKNLLAMKQKLVRESLKLDSLKQIIYSNFRSMAERGRQGSNNVILSENPVTNPVEIYSQDMSIYNQIQAVDRQLFLQPDFEMVDGFTQFSEPSSAGLIKILFISVLIAVGLGYVIVGLSQFNRYLASLE